jgi:hypothetical protein
MLTQLTRNEKNFLYLDEFKNKIEITQKPYYFDTSKTRFLKSHASITKLRCIEFEICIALSMKNFITKINFFVSSIFKVRKNDKIF